MLRSNVAALDGGGRMALRAGGSAPAADTLRIRGRTGDLTPLALLAGADSVALDSTLLDLTVTGPAERRKIEGHAEAYRLLYAGNLAERITARGCGNHGQHRVRLGRREHPHSGRRRRQAVGPPVGSGGPLRFSGFASGHRRRQRRHPARARARGNGGRGFHPGAAPAARPHRGGSDLAARSAGGDRTPARGRRGGRIHPRRGRPAHRHRRHLRPPRLQRHDPPVRWVRPRRAGAGSARPGRRPAGWRISALGAGDRTVG